MPSITKAVGKAAAKADNKSNAEAPPNESNRNSLDSNSSLSSAASKRPSITEPNLGNWSSLDDLPKYLLRVTAGPSYDPKTHKEVIVNGPTSFTVDNESMTAQIQVHIKGFQGLPTKSPTNSTYFDNPVHQKDRWSISFGFVPKKNINANDCVWGPDFDHPIRDKLPPGTSVAINIVKTIIDPTIECDAYADKPWMYSPVLACWDVVRVGEKFDAKRNAELVSLRRDGVILEGGDGDGQKIREELGVPDDASQRKKFFQDETNREKFVFEKGRLYEGDFFNPYLDFSDFSLKLPGFSVSVLKYINEKTHQLRWVFKNKVTGEVYFCVIFRLLYGDERGPALEADGVD